MGPVKYFKEVVYQAKKIRWPEFSKFMVVFGVVLSVIVIASIILMFESWAGVQLMNSIRDAFAPFRNVSSDSVAEAARLISSAVIK